MSKQEIIKEEQSKPDGYTLLPTVAVELTEPNHLDYKVKNKYDEWVWKSPYAMNKYADSWEVWHNQEREKFKQKYGLSDEELNYRGEIVRD